MNGSSVELSSPIWVWPSRTATKFNVEQTKWQRSTYRILPMIHSLRSPTCSYRQQRYWDRVLKSIFPRAKWREALFSCSYQHRLDPDREYQLTRNNPSYADWQETKVNKRSLVIIAWRRTTNRSYIHIAFQFIHEDLLLFRTQVDRSSTFEEIVVLQCWTRIGFFFIGGTAIDRWTLRDEAALGCRRETRVMSFYFDVIFEVNLVSGR